MTLVGQYSPSLFQEVFALMHEVVEGFTVEDWSTIAVCLHGAAACQGGEALTRKILSRADSEPSRQRASSTEAL